MECFQGAVGGPKGHIRSLIYPHSLVWLAFLLLSVLNINESNAFSSTQNLLSARKRVQTIVTVPPNHYSSSIFSQSCNDPYHQPLQRTTLSMAGSNQEEGSTASFLTTLIVLSLLFVYVGTLILPSVQETSSVPTSTVTVQESDGTTRTVGKYTSLTRIEINRKLSQIPVFYLETEVGSVALVDGEGQFFNNLPDAKAKLESLTNSNSELYGNVRISAVTLDQVWYPLIEKKAKVGTFVQGVVGRSDLQAPYKLVAGSKQASDANQVNSEVDISGLPLFFSKRVQFQGRTPGSKNQIPLFLDKDDLETTWSRLRESNKTLPPQPEIELTSLKAILRQMEQGGTEFARQYEFYPTIDQIDGINQLYGLTSGGDAVAKP